MSSREQVTGLVLAGGEGSRLGGVDKGLQDYSGVPLALHALRRLAPQVGRVMISANRHLDIYRQMGVPVCSDAPSPGGFEGPLAGFLAGMQRVETPYLVTVPCDCPHFPADLVQRLSLALNGEDAELAIAATRCEGRIRLEPAFCLMKPSLQASLWSFMQTGQRGIERWTAQHRRAEVVFDDAAAFFNINTPQELAQLRAQASR